ncbi:MAG: ABC transporter substrate-binding protein [Actinomycetales bacterium]|nr:ABC transporter substrate-binding protein [Actinomycetales bacterium]
MLSQAEQWNNVDPQRVYTGEDLAFFSGTIFRTLTAYKFSKDAKEGTSIVPDLATDTGTVADGGKTWSFTLRDGVTFETGAPITCADIKYGVSRTFATDIITNGPQYAVSMLDIPADPAGGSAYKGPYKKTGQDLYDKAVTCSADGKTITFHLSRPVPDFNYTTTLAAFAPVPQAADTGEKYDDKPVSSGPYKISVYKKGKGGQFILVRNDKWSQASDPYRQAYVDSWEVDFGIDPAVIDQRLISGAAADQATIAYGSLQPSSLPIVFNDPKFANRRTNEFDPYVRYFAVNVKKVPNVKIRQAIAVALDREALRTNAGGAYAGDFADGVIKPNIGIDYAPTGMWDGLLGKTIPSTGDPDYAKQLIQESGQPAPTITFDYPNTPTNAKAAAIIASSEAKAGITVKPNPIEAGQYYGVVFDPAKAHELINAGWGPDWPNASTVIPELFTPSGGFNLSQVDDKAFTAASDAAKVELDRAKQAKMWQDLNKQASQQVFTVPTRFGRDQRLPGAKIGNAYLWPAYGSWPYGDMYVTQ